MRKWKIVPSKTGRHLPGRQDYLLMSTEAIPLGIRAIFILFQFYFLQNKKWEEKKCVQFSRWKDLLTFYLKTNCFSMSLAHWSLWRNFFFPHGCFIFLSVVCLRARRLFKETFNMNKKTKCIVCCNENEGSRMVMEF